MSVLEKINKYLSEEKWSGDVKTHWHPSEGLFTKSAEDIASEITDNSDSLQQAESRLNFYLNRAGKNLDSERKATINKAKELVRKHFNES